MSLPSLASASPGGKRSGEELLARDARDLARKRVERVIKAASSGDLDSLKRICDKMVLISGPVDIPVYERDFDVNSQGQYKSTALHAAAEGGSEDALSYLLSIGADHEAVNMHGYTPLHCAARNGSLACALLLLRAPYSARPSPQDVKGNTPLHLVGRNPFNGKLVDVLHKFGADLNALNSVGETPLSVSVQSNTTDVSLALIAAGADVSIADHRGRHPLHWAAAFGNLPVITALKDAGAKIRCVDDDGNTALHRAAAHSLAATRLVHSYGAWLDARNKKGETALHIASKFGKRDVIAYLTEWGSYLGARTQEGHTAVDVAKSHRQSSAVDHLTHVASLDVDKKTQPQSWDAFRISLAEKYGAESGGGKAAKAVKYDSAVAEAERRYRLHQTARSSPKRM